MPVILYRLGSIIYNDLIAAVAPACSYSDRWSAEPVRQGCASRVFIDTLAVYYYCLGWDTILAGLGLYSGHLIDSS